jgi:hypothetical protein
MQISFLRRRQNNAQVRDGFRNAAPPDIDTAKSPIVRGIPGYDGLDLHLVWLLSAISCTVNIAAERRTRQWSESGARVLNPLLKGQS